MKETKREVVTKKLLAAKLSDKFNITNKQGKEEIDFLFDCIVDELCLGRDVYVDNFGTFKVHVRDVRIKSPKMEKAIEISDYKSPKFRPSKNLKDSVKES